MNQKFEELKELVKAESVKIASMTEDNRSLVQTNHKTVETSQFEFDDMFYIDRLTL